MARLATFGTSGKHKRFVARVAIAARILTPQDTRTPVQHGSISHGVGEMSSGRRVNINVTDITKIDYDIDFIAVICYKIARIRSGIVSSQRTVP